LKILFEKEGMIHVAAEFRRKKANPDCRRFIHDFPVTRCAGQADGQPMYGLPRSFIGETTDLRELRGGEPGGDSAQPKENYGLIQSSAISRPGLPGPEPFVPLGWGWWKCRKKFGSVADSMSWKK
jgi:hypothetical protein